LSLTGAAEPRWALLAIAVVVLSALVLAAVWARDLELLAETLRAV